MPAWIVALLAAAAALVPVGVVFTITILGHTYQDTGTGTGIFGAPGPIAGAGLPILLIVGAGYWAIRHFRKKAN
jgi:uncharacterized membrane protein YphA (DoxX/SURF4 family)